MRPAEEDLESGTFDLLVEKDSIEESPRRAVEGWCLACGYRAARRRPMSSPHRRNEEIS